MTFILNILSAAVLFSAGFAAGAWWVSIPR